MEINSLLAFSCIVPQFQNRLVNHQDNDVKCHASRMEAVEIIT